jgi:hypothetical protein
MLEWGAVEIICLIGLVLIGWLHMRQNNLENKLELKADKDDFNELKADVKVMADHVVDLKVDQTRCLTILERLEKSNSKND